MMLPPFPFTIQMSLGTPRLGGDHRSLTIWTSDEVAKDCLHRSKHWKVRSLCWDMPTGRDSLLEMRVLASGSDIIPMKRKPQVVHVPMELALGDPFTHGATTAARVKGMGDTPESARWAADQHDGHHVSTYLGANSSNDYCADELGAGMPFEDVEDRIDTMESDATLLFAAADGPSSSMAGVASDGNHGLDVGGVAKRAW